MHGGSSPGTGLRPARDLLQTGRHCGQHPQGKEATAISPVAVEAVRRINALFEVERDLNGHDPVARLEPRKARSAPLVEDVERWLRA